VGRGEVVVIAGGEKMVRERLAVPGEPGASVTRKEIMTGPPVAVVGVPEMRPEAEFRVRPWGRLAEVTEKV